ncbi:MAG: 3'-5' exonuclease [Candidatus Brocadiales bacterium]|nr:3'-5' exonuclease [Candidatus Brocadiales bacterium]
MTKRLLSKLLEDVTEPQREAITHLEGPLLVLAGAGSGKTRVITRRVAYLIDKGISPYNILAITFTNKAADEMKERVMRYYSYPDLWVSTFHSMCARVLRSEGNIERLGYSRYFSIYDTADTLGVIKLAMKELNLDPTHWKPATIAATISGAKNKLLSPEGLLKEHSGYFHRVASQVYAKYQSLLKTNNALDFDDLQVKLIELFTHHPEVLERYQDKFLFILIDEYQDTNFAQYVIQKLLAKKYHNICVTGDPDQSIYGWRGANLENILEFERDYPDAKVVKLEQNYRSTKRILQAASELIVHNKFRKSKGLWTENPEGNNIRLVHCEDEKAEAQEIASHIKELHQGDKRYLDMAVFYRTNAQSRVLETALRQDGIPYVLVGAVEFYQRKEIKDILAYLRLLANPNDEVAFDRVINTPPRGMGPGSLSKLKEWARLEGRSLQEATGQVIPSIKGKAMEGLKTFSKLLTSLHKMPPYPVREVVTTVIADTKYIHYLKESYTDEALLERLANVEELVNAAEEYDKANPESAGSAELTAEASGGLEDFLEKVALVQDIDTWDGHVEAVSLMTLHSAKGLEFPVVFICGLEDGLLPHAQSSQSEAEMEEERRLCYVGITRAKNELILTHARRRSRFGLETPSVPSRFLEELPRDVIQEIDKTLSLEEFYPGQMVNHPLFGPGRIVETQGYGKDRRAVVDFSTGQKTLLLEYARLEKIK